jgi:ADP-ribose pyrophosphatase YjhB (NUDIX family)
MNDNKFRLFVIGDPTKQDGRLLTRLSTLFSPFVPGELEPETVEVLVTGYFSDPETLTSTVARLESTGNYVSVITDALNYPDTIKAPLNLVFHGFHEQQVHLTKLGAVFARIKDRGYNRAEHSAALCLIIGRGLKKEVLVVDRNTEPLGLALPSGFLHIGGENLRQCSLRKTFEETSVRVPVSPDDLTSINVYSDPDMDPRDYVIESIFGCQVTKKATIDEIKGQIRPNLKAVKSASFIALREFAQGPVAFPRHLDATRRFGSFV